MSCILSLIFKKIQRVVRFVQNVRSGSWFFQNDKFLNFSKFSGEGWFFDKLLELGNVLNDDSYKKIKIWGLKKKIHIVDFCCICIGFFCCRCFGFFF